MSANPFRPAQRETYEQQLDLSAPDPNEKLVEDDSEPLVDVGLSSSTATHSTSELQPKFLESSASSLLPPTSGPIGPNNKLIGNASTGTTYSSNQNTNQAGPGSGFASRLCGFFSVEYYQPYFDVSTAVVLQRLKNGISPHKKDVFAGNEESSPPDLYGAVWISLTLVFLIGATSNLNSYLAHSATSEKTWDRDYTLLSLASTMVLINTFAIPVVIWGASLYTGVDPRPSLVKLIGTYGYAMVSFIPASLLCIVPVAWVQWICVLIAGAVSGVVLVRNLWNLFGQSYSPLSTQDTEAQTVESSGPSRSKSAFLLVCAAAAIHAVFTLMLKLFFFQGAELGNLLPPPSSSGDKPQTGT